MKLSSKLGPLPFMAAAESTVLQLDVQRVATALEGLHRRLFDAQRYFEALTRNTVKSARAHAAKAAADYLVERGWTDESGARKKFNDALVQVDQPSYGERLTQLIEPLIPVAPGLFGPDPDDWISIMTTVRNDQSHQFLQTNDFNDREISKYFVMELSGRWVLTLRILHEVLDGPRLHDALRQSSRFGFALANIDRDGFWGEHSALGTFRGAWHDQRNDVEG